MGPTVSTPEEEDTDEFPKLCEQKDHYGDVDKLAVDGKSLILDHKSECHTFVVPPDHDEDEPEEHAAEMGEVSYIIASRVGYAAEELEDAISDYEPFGFEWHWGEEQEDGGVREQHAESQQDAENRAGCAYSYVLVDVSFAIVEQLGVGHGANLVGRCSRIGHHERTGHGIVHTPAPGQLLNDGSTHAAYEIIDEEALRSPHLFEQPSEHIEREHVTEEVSKVGVHEHVCERLPDVVIRRIVIVEAEELGEVDALVAKYACGEEHHHVDDDEM